MTQNEFRKFHNRGFGPEVTPRAMRVKKSGSCDNIFFTKADVRLISDDYDNYEVLLDFPASDYIFTSKLQVHNLYFQVYFFKWSSSIDQQIQVSVFS